METPHTLDTRHRKPNLEMIRKLSAYGLALMMPVVLCRLLGRKNHPQAYPVLDPSYFNPDTPDNNDTIMAQLL